MKGLEPPRLSAPDPKSGAAASYATSAFLMQFRIPDWKTDCKSTKNPASRRPDSVLYRPNRENHFPAGRLRPADDPSANEKAGDG